MRLGLSPAKKRHPVLANRTSGTQPGRHHRVLPRRRPPAPRGLRRVAGRNGRARTPAHGHPMRNPDSTQTAARTAGHPAQGLRPILRPDGRNSSARHNPGTKSPAFAPHLETDRRLLATVLSRCVGRSAAIRSPAHPATYRHSRGRQPHPVRPFRRPAPNEMPGMGRQRGKRHPSVGTGKSCSGSEMRGRGRQPPRRHPPLCRPEPPVHPGQDGRPLGILDAQGEFQPAGVARHGRMDAPSPRNETFT